MKGETKARGLPPIENCTVQLKSTSPRMNSDISGISAPTNASDPSVSLVFRENQQRKAVTYSTSGDAQGAFTTPSSAPEPVITSE